MSFLFNNVATAPEQPPAPEHKATETVGGDTGKLYQNLIARRPALLEEKLKLHARIIDEFNLVLLEKLPRAELVKQVRAYVANYVRSENISLNQRELDIFSEEIIDEMTGYGPIEPLLKDPTVTDILINTHKLCFVERFGKLYPTKVHFKDEAHLLRIVSKIVAGVGRRVDESSPMVDARLPDGSRVNIAIRPIAIDGPLVSIRKFSERPFDMNRLLELGTICPPIVDLLTAAVHGRISLIISGGTGSGKTTMLNALSASIPAHERLITIEDAAELQLQQPHVGRLGDPSAQCGRQRRDPPTRARQERVTHAARSHHCRRMPWRRSLRHAAGDEYRARRLNDNHSRQLAALTPSSASSRWWEWPVWR